MSQAERIALNFLSRTSVIEVISAQIILFETQNNRPPMLLQLNRSLRAAFWREMAALSGEPLDKIAAMKIFVIGVTQVHFGGVQEDEYMRLFAPNCESTSL